MDNYDLLRAYVEGPGTDYVSGKLAREVRLEHDRVRATDTAGVLSFLRGKEIAAAVVMTRFRSQYSHLQTRINSGDGTDEELWFQVEEKQSQITPIAVLQHLTGGRTILLDVERVEMMGAEQFVREAIAGRF